ncbi:hypothetical protein BH11MYX2_BH11MYX2_33980 [soil metagenome]
MAMKETEGSLRGYFLLAGAISVAMALRDVGAASEISGAFLTAGQKAALYIPIVTRLLLGVAFVIAGVKLKSALLTGANWIKTMLVISGAMLLVDGALVTAVLGTDVGRGGIIGAGIGLAITAYLHHSVKRLADDAAATARGASPLPPARSL